MIAVTYNISFAIYIIYISEHIYVRSFNPFFPTVPTCSVRETASLGIMGPPLKPVRDDSALRALSSLRGLRGAPEVPPLCRETQSLGQQMLER